MKVAQFLSAISSPKVQTKSLHQTLENYLNSRMKKKFKLNQPKITLNNNKYSLWNLKEGINSTCLQTHSPFNNKRRNQINRNIGEKSKRIQQPMQQQNSFDYLKKRITGYSTWLIRRKLGKQKREYLRDYERFTYKSCLSQKNSETKDLRKQVANELINHKFCQLFNIKCGGCKCKLDCINKKFQQFLKSSDLIILKNLKKIVGRGQNLDATLKSQIMQIILSGNNKNDLENLLKKIKQRLLESNLKILQKKYISWAKDMFQLIDRIQKKQQKRKEATKKNHIELLNNQAVIINQTKRKYRFLTKKQNKKSSLPKKKQRRVQRTLSIQGSQIGSQRGSQRGSLIKQFSKNTSSLKSKNSSFALIDSKLKSKRRKFQESIIKKRAKINTLFSRKQSQSKHELSHFRMKHSLSIDKYTQQLHQQLKSAQRKLSQVSSQFDQETEEQVNQKLKLLENILKKEQKNTISTKLIKGARFIIDQNNNQSQIKHRGQKLSIKYNKKKSIANIDNQNLIRPRSKKQILQTQKIIRTNKKIKNRKSSTKRMSKFAQKEQKVNEKTHFYENNNKNHENNGEIQQNITHIMDNIKNSSSLVEKVQQQLLKAGLVYTIINQTDSYLTQKRKVKYIRQKLKKGALQRVAKDVEKYLEIVIGKNRLKNFFNLLEQNQQKKPVEIQDNSISNQLKQLMLKKKGLKFYDLTNVQKQNDPLQISILSSRDEKSKTKQKQIGLSGQFVYTLEAYVTQKQRTPFDFFHYLEMGKNYAKRKFVNQRINSNTEHQYKNIGQKQLRMNKENS